MMISFGVLGPVVVTVDGQSVALGGRQRKAVLAMLLLQAGATVSEEGLIWGLWGDDPPAKAVKTLRPYLALLRKLLEPHGIGLIRVGSGYRLHVDRRDVDEFQSKQLLDRGSAALSAGDPEQAQHLLRDALGLWRGMPLEDVADLPFAVPEVVRLGELRLRTCELRINAELQLGRHQAVIAELAALLECHPLRESLSATLATALYHADRQADALDVLRTTRQHLAEELGVDPGPRLVAVEMAILKQDLPPRALIEVSAGKRTAHPVPAQLPLDVRGFSGRDDELAALDAVLATAGNQPTAVVISAITGTAGIGKTTLAIHWARRVADRFGDGQLYVNLRGFDPGGQVMDPGEAVRGFLDAFAVPPQQIPAEAQAQTGLYRSLLAGKRVLVVLDNARDAEQVRPLLPGEPGCLAVVTSRNRLLGLLAAEGAHPLTLDLLTDPGARQMLTRRLGPARVAAEPQAITDIIARCARLPLALAIVSARAAAHPRFPLAAIAVELREARSGLDAFVGDDPTTDVRVVFSWSYQQLSADAARLFRLLGLHPGPDISAPAAASLAGLPPQRLQPLLAELAHAHLINERTPGRFTFHDLLRAYASERAHTTDREDERRAAVHRVLDHYAHAAYTAEWLLNPSKERALTPILILPGVTAAELTDPNEARTWLIDERSVILTAITQAASTGFDEHVCQLAWSVGKFLDGQGYWDDNVEIGRAALVAAYRLGDQPRQAIAHRGLAPACARLGLYDQARTHFGHAIDLYRKLDDASGQARSLLNLAWMLTMVVRDRYEEALHHSKDAIHLFQTVGNVGGQAHALNAMSWIHAHLGHHRQALTCGQQALGMFQSLGDHYSQAKTWDTLGLAYCGLGDHKQALISYHHALNIAREICTPSFEARVLTHLGDTLHAAGMLDAARNAWQRAFLIFDDLGHPDADEIRAKMNNSSAAPLK